ncbi:C45 family autoproteolytic acyltransferase/hydolase [Brevibacillus reuszeri]|uniref:C45 family autoproteolytic acyltransferase/hydolase n=1 Tax=Brevibacillus reuszeri TaxID=54915 RepID=UPI000CCC25D3|nr:C45 family peptidase [Brevibacillus reuszeri]
MQSKLDTANQRSSKAFPFYRFWGTHRQIGQQHGEELAALVKLHRDYAVERLHAMTQIPSEEALREAVLCYRSHVITHAPFFDEEIQGIAEGAGITLAEAYLLQLRAELYQDFAASAECTTYAIAADLTTNDTALIGQNADLPAFYSEIGVVAEIDPDDAPACLMLTPAGQLSYIGINRLGLGVFANFLTCDGWRVGFPRYLFSRFALTKKNVEDAIAAVRSLYRASSRNLIMLDAHGHAVDLETTASRDTMVYPKNGLLVHANHYISEELREEERLKGELLENSRVRLDRMRVLLEEKRGQLNAEVMQDLLRDRETYPHTLCVMPGDTSYLPTEDKRSDIITFASVIAEPTKGQLRVAIGPPNQFEYKTYTFSS